MNVHALRGKNSWTKVSPYLPGGGLDVEEAGPVASVAAEHQLPVATQVDVIGRQWRHGRVGRERVGHGDAVVDVVGEEEDGAVVVLVHDAHGDRDGGRQLWLAQVVGQHRELVAVTEGR